MRLIPLDVLGINLDIPFLPPLTKNAAELDSFATWLCDAENGLSLRPDQVRLKTWDDLFGYELVAYFFGDNGLITRTGERIKLSIRNARTAGDWEIVRRVLVRFTPTWRFHRSRSPLFRLMPIRGFPPRNSSICIFGSSPSLRYRRGPPFLAT